MNIRDIAFNITAGFEGAGYSTYQNYDSGIVSYGFMQFTLASGSLWKVIERYIRLFGTGTALFPYARRAATKDPTLRDDAGFKDALLQAATSSLMWKAQNDTATELYWNKVQSVTIMPRGLVLPLSVAFLFDCAINHGVYHDLVTLAEDRLGVPHHTRVDYIEQEKKLAQEVVNIRALRLNKIASDRHLPGLIPRGKFWADQVAADNWNLVGDKDGNLQIKSGVKVKVNEPQNGSEREDHAADQRTHS